MYRENINGYKPHEWATNGPGTLTRVLRKICRINDIYSMKPEYCWGFKVFGPETFYAIYYPIWRHFFETNPTVVNSTLDKIKNSISIHVWNKLSKNEIIDKNKPKTAYGIVAEKNCPKVFESTGRYF